MLDVIPSTMPGMAFETRKAIYDQQVRLPNFIIERDSFQAKTDCFSSTSI